MSDTTYDVGDVATLTASFTNAAGAAADPTAVTLTVQAPDGTQTTPTPTSSVTGTWTADVSITQAGVWRYRFAGTGAVVATEVGEFDAVPLLVPATAPSATPRRTVIPQALLATEMTDVAWAIPVAWPPGWATCDLTSMSSVAFAAGDEGDDWSEADLAADLTSGVTATSAFVATVSLDADDWPDTYRREMAWGITVQDASGNEAQVARGTLRVLPRTPRDTP